MIQKIGSLSENGGPILVDRIITNSVVMGVGYSVKTASGFAALGTAGAAVLGHVVSIFKNGSELGPDTDGSAGASFGSYLGNAGSTYTAAADNQTVAKVSVKVDIDKLSLYSAELDAAAGTTTGSDLADYNLDLTDKDTLDESTAATTSAQYHSHGLDANNTAQVVVNILESQVFGV